MMSIREIAQANNSAGNSYFSADTLSFYGQKLTSFSTVQRNNKIFIYAKSRLYIRGRRTFTGWSISQFDPETGETSSITPPDEILLSKSRKKVVEFLINLAWGGQPAPCAHKA